MPMPMHTNTTYRYMLEYDVQNQTIITAYWFIVAWQVKIFLIARERDVRGAMALMEQGVDPNTKCPERDYTPLIAAVFNQVLASSS